MHADKWEKAQCTWGTEKRPAWLESVGSNMVYPQSPVLSSFYLFSFQVFKIEAYFTKIKYLHCNIGQWVLTTANTQVNHHQIKIQCFLLFKKLPNIPFPKFLPPKPWGATVLIPVTQICLVCSWNHAVCTCLSTLCFSDTSVLFQQLPPGSWFSVGFAEVNGSHKFRPNQNNFINDGFS